MDYKLKQLGIDFEQKMRNFEMYHTLELGYSKGYDIHIDVFLGMQGYDNLDVPFHLPAFKEGMVTLSLRVEAIRNYVNSPESADIRYSATFNGAGYEMVIPKGRILAVYFNREYFRGNSTVITGMTAEQYDEYNKKTLEIISEKFPPVTEVEVGNSDQPSNVLQFPRGKLH